jgi:hypothetical protein
MKQSDLGKSLDPTVLSRYIFPIRGDIYVLPAEGNTFILSEMTYYYAMLGVSVFCIAHTLYTPPIFFLTGQYSRKQDARGGGGGTYS